MDYEALLCEAEENGLIVKEKHLKYNNGRIKGNRIAIRKGIPTTTEKACVLAEELGHHYTTVGDILDQSDDGNRKQEQQARTWAYTKMVTPTDIVNAYKNGYENAYDIAEYLNVTEEFLNSALERYHEKYGKYTTVDNYTIFFEPHFAILEVQPGTIPFYRWAK